MSTKHHGLETKEAVDSLYRVDSLFRESMRLSDVGANSLPLDVMGTGPIDIGHGIQVPKGVRMMFPSQAIHLDPENFNNPTTFDAFRFSRDFEDSNDAVAEKQVGERALATTLTKSWLVFGYGRHGCPGRWFVAQTIKQALAHIVLNYDIELIGKPIQRKALLNMMLPPVDAQMRYRYKASISGKGL